LQTDCAGATKRSSGESELEKSVSRLIPVRTIGSSLKPRNDAAVGRESTISADESSIRVEVVPVDEATLLALDAVRLLRHADEPE